MGIPFLLGDEDQYAGWFTDGLLDQNSKLITNMPYNVYTDQACTMLANIYTDRSKDVSVDQSTLVTDPLGMVAFFTEPATVWIRVVGSTQPRQVQVKEDIDDTANEIEVLHVGNNLSDLTDVSAARTHLGLGSAATMAASAFDAAGSAAAALATAEAYTNSVAFASGGGVPASGALLSSNNLDDVNNVASARTNLGLGSAATMAASAFDNAGAAASAAAAALLAAEAYTNLVAFASGGSPPASGTLLAANNLHDLNNVGAARTNLGLGSAATQAASAFDNAGAAASAYGLAVTADALKLSKANNLNDVASASGARTNLGLGSAATMAASAFDAAGSAAASAAAALATAEAYTNAAIAASGGGAPLVIAASGNATAVAGQFINLNTAAAGSGGYTVTLPTAVVGNEPVWVEQNGSNPAKITGNIKGSTQTLTIGVNGAVMMFVAAAGTWRIASMYYPTTTFARLDQDNDFNGNVLRDYADDELSFTGTTATVGTDIPWGSARQLTASAGCAVTLPATAPKRGAWIVLGQGSGAQDTIAPASGAYMVGTGSFSGTAKTIDQNSRVLIQCIDPTPGASVYIISGNFTS